MCSQERGKKKKKILCLTTATLAGEGKKKKIFCRGEKKRIFAAVKGEENPYSAVTSAGREKEIG